MRIWTRDNMNWIHAPDGAEASDVVRWAGGWWKVVDGSGGLRCVPTTERGKREKPKATQPIHKKADALPATQPVPNGRRPKGRPPAARGKRARSV